MSYYLSVLSITDAVICYTDMTKQGDKLSLFIAATLIQLWQSTPNMVIHYDHDRHHQQCLLHKNKALALP